MKKITITLQDLELLKSHVSTDGWTEEHIQAENKADEIANNLIEYVKTLPGQKISFSITRKNKKN